MNVCSGLHTPSSPGIRRRLPSRISIASPPPLCTDWSDSLDYLGLLKLLPSWLFSSLRLQSRHAGHRSSQEDMIRSWRLSPSFHCLRLVPGEPSGFGPNSTRLAVFSSIQGRTLSSARARGDQPLATARHDSFRPSKRLKTQPRPPIAVLGGGLSGLTTTLYLSRLLPDRRILLVESSNHLGGWVRSERVALPQGGHAIVEAGPRSIRPKGAAGWIMIEMVSSATTMSHSRVRVH